MPKLSDEVKYLKGVGPARAEVLAKRGIISVEDLIGYLPFRYEDRSHFSQIADVVPGNVYTLRVEVLEGQAIRYSRSSRSVYMLIVQDESLRRLHCRFFHGGFMEGRYKKGQQLVLHGKVDFDPNRPVRLEMINPQVETIGPGDSTEVGRIVPIYEAMGAISSRMLRRIVHQALGALPPDFPDRIPADILKRHGYPNRREALMYVHFPPQEENIEKLNSFRSPAHMRLIFEELFFYELSLAMRKRNMQQTAGHRISCSRTGDSRSGEAHSCHSSRPARKNECWGKLPRIWKSLRR